MPMHSIEISDTITILTDLLDLPRGDINTPSIKLCELAWTVYDRFEPFISDAHNYHHFLVHVEICCSPLVEPSPIDWMGFGTIAFGQHQNLASAALPNGFLLHGILTF